MSMTLSVPDRTEFKPRITIVGLGGGGCNAVDNMMETGLEGVDFIVCNTDVQALQRTRCERRIQLGSALTEGLGAGSDAEVGRRATEETLDEVMDAIGDTHMLFVVAGMGGGTGSGSAPVIAKAATDKDILTVAVVTKPFSFEAMVREETAEAGIAALRGAADSHIVVSNQNLFKVTEEATSFVESFRIADEVLSAGVRGVADLIMKPGVVNVDFADVRSVLQRSGAAIMGTGEGIGGDRVQQATSAAINNPLLEDIPTDRAKGLLVNITAAEPTLSEVERIVDMIRDKTHRRVNLIFGTAIDERLGDSLRVSVMMAGLDDMSAPKGNTEKKLLANPAFGFPSESNESAQSESESSFPPSDIGDGSVGIGNDFSHDSHLEIEDEGEIVSEKKLCEEASLGNGMAEATSSDESEDHSSWPESGDGGSAHNLGEPGMTEVHDPQESLVEEVAAPDTTFPYERASHETDPLLSASSREEKPGFIGRIFDFGKEQERREPKLENIPIFDDEESEPPVTSTPAVDCETLTTEAPEESREESMLPMAAPVELKKESNEESREESMLPMAARADSSVSVTSEVEPADNNVESTPEVEPRDKGMSAVVEAKLSGNGINASGMQSSGVHTASSAASAGGSVGQMVVSEHSENLDAFKIPAFLRRG